MPGPYGGRDRLGADREPLHRAGSCLALAGGRAEPGGGGRDGVRPRTGPTLVDALRDGHTLTTYPLLAAVRGDLLAKLGRDDEARAEFARAAALTRNASEQRLFLRRAGAAEDHTSAGRMAD